MTIKTFQLMSENAGKWYNQLPDPEKQKIQSAVNRANKAMNWVKLNGLPAHYIGAGAKIAKRHNADPSSLPDEAIFALDNTIARTVADQAIFQQFVSSVSVPLAKPVWESKAYKIDELDVNSAKTYPKPDQNFRNPTQFKIGIEPSKYTGMGFSIAYEIPWTEIAQSSGSIYSPTFYYALVAAERMGIIIDENGWNGGAGQHMDYDYGGKGIMNHASIQSFTPGTLTTFGGLLTAMWDALRDFKTIFQDGTIKCVMTSGIASQFYYNRFTYDYMSEYVKVVDEIRAICPEAYIDDRLRASAAPDNTHQQWAFVKMGPTLCKHSIVYPLQTKPMLNKTYAEDIKEALIYGDITTFYANSPFPITCSGDATTTDTGFLPNGRLW